VPRPTPLGPACLRVVASRLWAVSADRIGQQQPERRGRGKGFTAQLADTRKGKAGLGGQTYGSLDGLVTLEALKGVEGRGKSARARSFAHPTR
jgi:hypothetical protein